MKMSVVVAIVLILLFSSPVWSVKVQDIAKTAHNLSSSGPSLTYASNPFDPNAEDQICVFCHTPHGGSLDGPLWNRSNSGLTAPGAFTFYTSDTLTTEARTIAAVTPDSLLCLSCHDGSVAVGDNLINTSKPNPPDNSIVFIEGLGVYPAARIGGTKANSADTGNLSDDHPISFNYVAAQGEDSSIRAIDDAAGPKAKGLRFYGAGQNYLECGTCHDPHVDYSLATGDTAYAPFLAIPNTNSQMCLACHIK